MSQTNTNKEHKMRSILERSSNIDAATLQKYIDKKLTKEELHEVEKQLLNSDFASEAMEGFGNADFKVNITASTQQLNKEIKKYNKERGFYKRNYAFVYAAATVALIFVFVFGLTRGFMNLQQNEMMADKSSISTDNAENNLALNQDNEEPNDKLTEELKTKLETQEVVEQQTKPENSTPTSDTKRSKTQNNLALNKTETAKKQDFATSDIWITKKEKVKTEQEKIEQEKIEKTNSQAGQTLTPITSERVGAATPIVETTEQESKKQNNTSNSVADQLADDDLPFFKDKNIAGNVASTPKTEKEILFDALHFYESKKYTEASLLFDSYLVTNPNDAQALYFGGMSSYQNHDYKKSIPLLEKFLKQTSSIVYQKNKQDAEWFLANAYLKINQNQKAKTVLQKIIDSNSKYSSQATDLLKK